MANKSAPTFRAEEVLQQLSNLNSDDSDKEFIEKEDESEVNINEPYLDNASSSGSDDEYEPYAKRIYELNKDQIP